MNIIRCSISALAMTLLSGAAFAAPALKASVVVDGPIVTVGDMFDDAGLLAEAAIFRSPQPGTTGDVDLNAIRLATARVGLTNFNVNGLASVRVTRAAALVDHDLLAGLIAADLRERGVLGPDMSVSLQFSQQFDPIRTAAADVPARLDSLRYMPGNGTFNARFTLAGIARPLDISGTAAISIEAPHLAASLPAGTVLMPQHIVMRPIPVAQADAQGIPPIGQLVGMALNRQSRDGMLLRATDVSKPLSVAKNDIVTIMYRHGPMTLTVRGQAVTGAPEGAPLQVLNLVSRRVISATAIGPGVVAVSTAPVTLAGL